MAEITSSGYQSIRDFVESNWKYIELRSDANTPILRLGVGDPRVSWIHNEGAQTLELQIVVKGSDPEINLPMTFASSAIYSQASGGSAHSVETFSPFTMEATGDELTVIHQLEIPEVL